MTEKGAIANRAHPTMVNLRIEPPAVSGGSWKPHDSACRRRRMMVRERTDGGNRGVAGAAPMAHIERNGTQIERIRRERFRYGRHSRATSNL
jgi:hypothetical protein